MYAQRASSPPVKLCTIPRKRKIQFTKHICKGNTRFNLILCRDVMHA